MFLHLTAYIPPKNMIVGKLFLTEREAWLEDEHLFTYISKMIFSIILTLMAGYREKNPAEISYPRFQKKKKLCNFVFPLLTCVRSSE